MRFLLALLVLLSSCDKPVSDDQRELLREELKKRTPVRISDDQILSRALEEARRDWSDTTVTVYRWKDYFVKPADSLLAELWLAYEYAVQNNSNVVDNVQLKGPEIIYTNPIVLSDSLQRMRVAFIPKKSIVLKITTENK